MTNYVLIWSCFVLALISFFVSVVLIWRMKAAMETAEAATKEVAEQAAVPASRGVFDITAALKAISELVATLGKSAPYLSYLAASVLFLALTMYGNGTLTMPVSPKGAPADAAGDKAPAQGGANELKAETKFYPFGSLELMWPLQKTLAKRTIAISQPGTHASRRLMPATRLRQALGREPTGSFPAMAK